MLKLCWQIKDMSVHFDGAWWK